MIKNLKTTIRFFIYVYYIILKKTKTGRICPIISFFMLLFCRLITYKNIMTKNVSTLSTYLYLVMDFEYLQSIKDIAFIKNID